MNIGIDYGSKLAGTTVIAYQLEGLVYLVKSGKNQDADQMILEFVKEHNVNITGIDAPLSLPGVYSKLEGCDDYHYRACDKALKAMSPMFLGGLTARAMKLQDTLTSKGITVVETYPVKTGKLLFAEEMSYRGKTPDYSAMMNLLKEKGLILADSVKVTSSHDLDAILALNAVDGISAGLTVSVGDSREGIIYY